MKNIPLSLQELPPPCARLCLEVRDICLEQGAGEGANILLAVSGGADSTALALIFRILAPRLRLNSLSCLHVDHCLRPESAADARHVLALCRRLHIPCKIVKVDVAALAADLSLGLEEAGRMARQRELREFRRQTGADLICTGHHLDDLCEDVIMRLARGCGWPALGGMRLREGCCFRPLLFLTSGRLREFLAAVGVGWREDQSNQDEAFLRNRMRHRLLPLLRAENPSLGETIWNLHELAALDEDFWQQSLAQSLAANPPREEARDGLFCIVLPKKLLAGMHPALRLRLYHRMIKILHEKSGRGSARARTLFELDRALASGRGGKIFQLPGGIEAIPRKGEILFRCSLERL